MASSNHLHESPMDSIASEVLEQPEDSKDAWPSDLLNINDAEMAKLFDPNCNHSQYHEDFQEVVSSSTASLPLHNESLESIMEELDILSQPVFDPIVNMGEKGIGKETFMNFPNSTAEFLCNEDSFKSPIQNVPPFQEDAYQSENREAVAVMSLSPETVIDRGGTEVIMITDNADSSSGFEAATPDDSICILKNSANHDMLTTDKRDHAFAFLKTSEQVMETILSVVEFAKPSPCISVCVPLHEVKALPVVSPVSPDFEANMSGPQFHQLQPKGEQQDISEEQISPVLSIQDQKSFSCTSCDQNFLKITNLYRHSSVHTQNPVLCCDDCEVTFVSAKELLSHYVVEHNCTDGFVCALCQMEVASYPELKEHVGRHTNEEPFQCSECSLPFREYPEFCIHCQGHTHEPLLKCLICHYVFQHEPDLHNHVKFLHSVEKHAESNSCLKFLCETCGDFFDELKALTNHSINVHRPSQSNIILVQCGVCGKSFKKGKSLTMHVIRTHHQKKLVKKTLKETPKPTLKCGVCEKKFHIMSVYSRHVLTAHKTQTRLSSLNAKARIKILSASFTGKEVTCEICDATFFQAVELKKHVRAFHLMK